jgi:ATPase components of ABC transporters with duplicated ATPase domains
LKTLNISNASKTFGERTLFKNVTFTISEGDRIGLLGLNGAGKTTLLDGIVNNNDLNTIEIEKPKDYRITYLKQQPDLDLNLSVIDAVFASSSEKFQLVREYEHALNKLIYILTIKKFKMTSLSCKKR